MLPVQHVVVVGATGFWGRALTLLLLGEGYRVTALARSPERARNLLPADVVVADLASRDAPRSRIWSTTASRSIPSMPPGSRCRRISASAARATG